MPKFSELDILNEREEKVINQVIRMQANGEIDFTGLTKEQILDSLPCRYIKPEKLYKILVDVGVIKENK